MPNQIRTCLSYLRQRCWRPSRRRYLWLHVCRFLECWWNATWLYLGFVAVLAAFFVDKVKGEPTVIVLCIAMILTVRNLKNDRGISILTGILGLFAAVLALPEKSQVGALNLGLWGLIGSFVGISAFTTIVFYPLWLQVRGPVRSRQRQQRRRMAKRGRTGRNP